MKRSRSRTKYARRLRDLAYLDWIRTLPCAICGVFATESWPNEAAHTNALGGRGLSQKTSDRSCIPLCHRCHQENPDSYHRLGERVWTEVHRLDLSALVARLNECY